MKATDERNAAIIDAFFDLGIYPRRVDEGLLVFNRDQCHNALNMHEWDIIDKISTIVKEAAGEGYYTCASFKTDDYWYWEINKK